ncbi:Uncharacterised protein [Mycobacteroides abscessus subsp. massiliense]|nr:Uncharacterised protein [Mycobacteroides abscessus subsp. massiliense]
MTNRPDALDATPYEIRVALLTACGGGATA